MMGIPRCEKCGAGPAGNCGFYGCETPRETCPLRAGGTVTGRMVGPKDPPMHNLPLTPKQTQLKKQLFAAMYGAGQINQALITGEYPPRDPFEGGR